MQENENMRTIGVKFFKIMLNMNFQYIRWTMAISTQNENTNLL